MDKSATWARYEERLSRVTAYIHDHLDEEIDLQKLAEIACLSPYHWHRIYRAVQGETIAATVKRLRLHRAAGHLAHSDMAIEEVAERCGYPNLQSFTRIFKSVYGMPPAQYRKAGSHRQFQGPERERMMEMYDVEIRTVPAMKLHNIEHRGSYMEIGKAFEQVAGWFAAHNRLGEVTRSIGIYYDDPDAVAEARLRSRAGVVLRDDASADTPWEVTEILGGEHAVLRYKGPYADMMPAYQWFFEEWLRNSGHEAADAPMFEEYLNDPRDTPPTELLTDIYMPLGK